MGQSPRHFLKENPHFHACDILAHALMTAIAKSQMIDGIVTVDVEFVTLLEMTFVLIAGSLNDQQFGPFRQVGPSHPGRGGGLSSPGDDGPGIPQAFLHRVGNQLRILADVFPGLPVGQQGLEHIGRRQRSRFMGGNDDRHHHRMDITIRHNIRHFGIFSDRFVHPTGAARLILHLLDYFSRIIPEPTDIMRNGDLLRVGWLAPDIHRMRNREIAQDRDVVFGDTEEMQRHVQRHFIEHGSNEIDPTAVDEGVHFLARQLADHLLIGFEIFRQEMSHQYPPTLHMSRFILVHHGSAHGIAVTVQDLHRLGRRGCDLFKHVSGRKQDVIAKDGLDIVVAADYPVAEPRAEEDGQLLSRPAQRRRRIELIGTGKRIEFSSLLGKWTLAAGRCRPIFSMQRSGCRIALDDSGGLSVG